MDVDPVSPIPCQFQRPQIVGLSASGAPAASGARAPSTFTIGAYQSTASRKRSLLGIHRRFGESVGVGSPGLARVWDAALVEIHYGTGVGGAVYHILLGIAVVGVAAAGIAIYLQIRARLRR